MVRRSAWAPVGPHRRFQIRSRAPSLTGRKEELLMMVYCNIVPMIFFRDFGTGQYDYRLGIWAGTYPRIDVHEEIQLLGSL